MPLSRSKHSKLKTHDIPIRAFFALYQAHLQSGEAAKEAPDHDPDPYPDPYRGRDLNSETKLERLSAGESLSAAAAPAPPGEQPKQGDGDARESPSAPVSSLPLRTPRGSIAASSPSAARQTPGGPPTRSPARSVGGTPPRKEAARALSPAGTGGGAGAGLIKAEGKETGSVSWQVYWRYFQMCGLALSALCITLLVRIAKAKTAEPRAAPLQTLLAVCARTRPAALCADGGCNQLFSNSM
jgi:hypothetical protein